MKRLAWTLPLILLLAFTPPLLPGLLEEPAPSLEDDAGGTDRVRVTPADVAEAARLAGLPAPRTPAEVPPTLMPALQRLLATRAALDGGAGEPEPPTPGVVLWLDVPGDLDGDGAADAVHLLLDPAARPLAEARSGATGARLWQLELPQRAPTAYAHLRINAWNYLQLPGDVTGDGVPDLVLAAEELYVSVTQHIPRNIEGLYTVVDGRTGGTLWSLTLTDRLHSTVRIRFMPFADVDGDGRSDLLYETFRRVGGGSGYALAGTYRVLQGATGHPLREVGVPTATMPGAALAGVADVTGDGAPDVVVLQAEAGSPSYATVKSVALLAAYDGPTGDLLWATPLPDLGTGFGEGSSAAVLDLGRDLDGDGHPDALLQVGGRFAPDLSHASGYLLWAVSGRTGALLWQHAAREHMAGFASMPDVTGDGRVDIFLLEYDRLNWTTGHWQWLLLVVLDGTTGTRVADLALTRALGAPEDLVFLTLSYDLTGDGVPDPVVAPAGTTAQRLLDTGAGFRSVWQKDLGSVTAFLCGGGADRSGDGTPDGMALVVESWKGYRAAGRNHLLVNLTLSSVDGATGVAHWTRALGYQIPFSNGYFCNGPMPDLTGDGLGDVLGVTYTLDGNVLTGSQTLLDGRTGATVYEVPLARYG